MSEAIFLGIESAITGGSVCITSNGREIGAWVGNQSISKAEELLPNIDRLLRENSLGLLDIHRVIVSIGPGSFTGIKVGIATVFGFRAASGLTCLGIDALSAMSLSAIGTDAIIVVPVGRGTICIQSFSNGKPTSELELVNDGEIDALSQRSSKLVLHGSLFDSERFPSAINAGWNIASYLCSAVDSEFVSSDIRPLFLERKSSNI